MAVAAMRLSLIGMAFPVVRRRASSSAHFEPRVRVPGKTPESELAENDGIDGDIPLMCAKPRHDPRIGRWFRRLAQNAGVDQVLHSASVDSESGDEKILPRTGEQPVNGALVQRSRTPDQAIVPAIDTLDVELLPRLDSVHPPELRR
jgi:hypothetical protein